MPKQVLLYFTMKHLTILATQDNSKNLPEQIQSVFQIIPAGYQPIQLPVRLSVSVVLLLRMVRKGGHYSLPTVLLRRTGFTISSNRSARSIDTESFAFSSWFPSLADFSASTFSISGLFSPVFPDLSDFL